ncbi:GGDEF domain-containing protein [Micromonosporaceae bacterium Da 78-11]
MRSSSRCCPARTARQAAVVVERALGVTPLGQTFSAGLAVWDGAETSDELIQRADAALYVAKDGGRNRVEIAPGDQAAKVYPTREAACRPAAAAVRK